MKPGGTQGTGSSPQGLAFPPQAGPASCGSAARGAGRGGGAQGCVPGATRAQPREPRNASWKSNREETGKGGCGVLPCGPAPRSGGPCHPRRSPEGRLRSADAGPSGRRRSLGLEAWRRRPRPGTNASARGSRVRCRAPGSPRPLSLCPPLSAGLSSPLSRLPGPNPLPPPALGASNSPRGDAACSLRELGSRTRAASSTFPSPAETCWWLRPHLRSGDAQSSARPRPLPGGTGRPSRAPSACALRRARSAAGAATAASPAG